MINRDFRQPVKFYDIDRLSDATGERQFPLARNPPAKACHGDLSGNPEKPKETNYYP